MSQDSSSIVSSTYPQQTPAEPKWSRDELDEMVRRWLEANERAEAEGDWKKHLGPMYAHDAEYRWMVGPHREFVARGREEIQRLALGFHMEGFEDWTYPYERLVVDEHAGEVVAFWRQVSPYRRADGTAYEVPGTTPSRFRYAGDFQWSLHVDHLELMSIIATLLELAAEGHLDRRVAHKIQELAWGKMMPGDVELPHAPGLAGKLAQGRALTRILLTGR